MANKLSFAFFLAFTFLLVAVHASSMNGGQGSLHTEECPKACDFRCSATSHRKACLFFCNQCCRKCLCVPSGTYGHKQECPCYDNWKTKRGTPKCP